MASFGSFSGVITKIDDFRTGIGEAKGCYKIMTLQNNERGIANFIISPNTYFVDHIMMMVGEQVTGFYYANAPIPLIYPPQYPSIVIARLIEGQNVKVDYFNEELVSSDNTLKLNISPFTHQMLQNDQEFTGDPANHNLIVIYGPTTRSIAAQTTPYEIIVLCPKT